MKPTISIIIPIHNTEKCLSTCLNSCLNQDMKDFELILVNDASTDNSLSICKQYQENRIRIIDKAINEGVEKARYTGYLAAQGKYIMFIDSDDWLTNRHVLSLMLNKATETNADYVEVNMQRVMGERCWIKKKSKSLVTGLITQPELFEKYYISFFGVNIFSVSMCGKLYKKSILDKVDLAPLGLHMGEDLAFNLRLFPHLTKIYILNDIGYNYRYGGMTGKYNPYLLPDLKYLFCLKEECIRLYNYWKAIDFINIELKNVFCSDVCQMILYKHENKDALISKIKEELSDPTYTRMLNINDHPEFLKDPIVIAMKEKDAETIYRIHKEQTDKRRFLRFAKRIAFELSKF